MILATSSHYDTVANYDTAVRFYLVGVFIVITEYLDLLCDGDVMVTVASFPILFCLFFQNESDLFYPAR